jgi:MFS family permease
MLKTFFLGNIILLILVQYLFINWSDSKQNIMIILLIYFVGFNFLEATLPSLISRLSPKNLKGLVLGAYNTSQSLGIFVGGILGGFIASRYGNQAIFIVSALFLLIWLFAMIKFIFPANRKDLVLKINPKFFLLSKNLTDEIYKKINRLEFVEETLIFPSESYIIIKSKNDLTLDQKKIIKIIGEKYAIS